jgi:hypothetical protein
MQVSLQSNGLPELYAAPVSRLVKDAPLKPALLGHLVPSQLNIWMGASKHGQPVCLTKQHRV